jgi:hypothetical protein
MRGVSYIIMFDCSLFATHSHQWHVKGPFTSTACCVLSLPPSCPSFLLAQTTSPYKCWLLSIRVIIQTYPPMKMEQIQCSETSAYKIQTPGNYPEDNILHPQHCESLKTTTFSLSSLYVGCSESNALHFFSFFINDSNV